LVGAQAAVVIDHAEAADHGGCGVWHLDALRAPGELAQRLDQAEIAAGGAGLAHAELAAGGVVRKIAGASEVVRADEGGGFTFGAEAEILELHHHDHRVVVIGLQQVDIVGGFVGHGVELGAIDRPAGAELDWVVGERVVAFDGG
jgi:hypothetical protein